MVMKMQNNTDKLKLLELTRSESDSDSPQFSIPKRKVRFKKRFRPNSKVKSVPEVGESCSCQCVQHARLVLNIVLFIVVAILIWFITNLNTKVEGLQKLLNDLESGNKNTPEEFHDIHNGLQILGHNVTSLGLELNKASSEIQAISTEVKAVQEVAEGLAKSIAAAPEIKGLPNTVHSLSENLAKIGSKITVVESDVKQMKLQHESFTTSIHTIENGITDVKKELSGLYSYVHSNLTLRVESSEQATDMTRINGSEEINQTINEAIREDFFKHYMANLTINDIINCNTELKQLRASVKKLNTGFDDLNNADNVAAIRINNLQKTLQQLLTIGTKDEKHGASSSTYQESQNATNS